MINLQLVQPPHSSLIAKTDEFWRVDPAVSGGGLFHDLAPHQLDLMQFFFGDYINASGFSMNQGKLYAAEDLVMGTVLFANDVLFNGSWCFTGAENEEKDFVEIIGSEGSIRFTTFNTHHIIVSKKGEERTIAFDELPHVQQPMINAVVKYFLDEAPNPSTAESAVKTMQIIDAFTAKNNADR
jgi:predicted dehydrogenase